MLAVCAVVLWLLPTIIAKTPLFPWILKLATTDLNGSVTVNSASLGWLSPIEVQGIEVKDANGKMVLSVGSVVGDRRLGSILLNYSNLGKFTLRETKLSVAMRDDGTNVEDMLAKYLVPKEEPSSTNVALATRNCRRRRVGPRRTDRAGLANPEVVDEIRHGRRRRRRDERRGGHRLVRHAQAPASSRPA